MRILTQTEKQDGYKLEILCLDPINLLNNLKGCLSFGNMEWYWYHNPVTGFDEHRNTYERYDDEEKCKLCKHKFEKVNEL